jgi:hypothetical protein
MRRSLLWLSFLMLIVAVSLCGQQTAGIGVRLIVVKTEEEAAGLQSRLQAGEAFEELANKYSSDASASAGGLLGIVLIGDLKKEFQDVLAGLRPGQVSPIVKISEGNALLQVVPEAEAHDLLGKELGMYAATPRSPRHLSNSARRGPAVLMCPTLPVESGTVGRQQWARKAERKKIGGSLKNSWLGSNRPWDRKASP